MTEATPARGIKIGAVYPQDITLSARIECWCCSTTTIIIQEMNDSALTEIIQTVYSNGWRSVELPDEIFTTICPHCINTLDKGDDDE